MGLKTVGDVEKFMSAPDDRLMVHGKPYYFGKKCIKEVRALLKELELGAES
jgi:hypothetical protein